MSEDNTQMLKNKKLAIALAAIFICVCSFFAVPLWSAAAMVVYKVGESDHFYVKQDIHSLITIPESDCGSMVNSREVAVRAKDGARVEKLITQTCGPKGTTRKPDIVYHVKSPQFMSTVAVTPSGNYVKTTYVLKDGVFASDNLGKPNKLFDCLRDSAGRSSPDVVEDLGEHVVGDIKVRRVRMTSRNAEQVESLALDLGCEAVAYTVVRPDAKVNQVVTPVLLKKGLDSEGEAERLFREVNMAQEVDPVKFAAMRRGITEEELLVVSPKMAVYRDIYHGRLTAKEIGEKLRPTPVK
jgi:predicted DNA binding protein